MGTPISSLPLASTLTGTEYVPVVQSGVTKRVADLDIAKLILPVTTTGITDGNVTAAKLAADSVTTVKILDANVTLEKLAAAVVDALLPAGAVAHFARNTAPSGWLKANGAAINRTTYATLFSAIGTTFGAGDGSTTFNLPDLRGEFVRGWDDGRTVDSGRAFGTSQAQQTAYHKHMTAWGENSTGAFGNTSSGGRQGSSGTDYDNKWYMTNDGSDYDATVNAAGVIGTETRPRNVALLACIKY